MKNKNIKLILLSSLLASQSVFAEPLSVEGAENIVEESREITVHADGTPMSMEASASASDVAKKLANPIAAMISLPIQGNYQPNLGVNDEGSQWLVNVQPVVPIDFNDEWNIISRTIVPLVSKDTGIPGEGHNSVADIVQSAWLSPKAPTESGWIWGVGAAFLIPTGSEVSAEKWGVGPTAIALKQDGPWTYGGLFNHIWDFAGNDINDINGNTLNNINQTFMQPFLTYITPQAVTIALNTESIYDWERDQWTVPINLTVTKVVKVGGQILSVGGGVTYWADAPDSGPEGWGARLLLTFIFPK